MSKRLLRGSTVMLLAGLCGGLAGTVLAGSSRGTGDVVVSVQGLHSTRGIVRWALYPSAEAFSNAVHSEGSQPVRKGTCRPEEGECRFTIPRLEHGDYALLLHHDENGNNKVDKRFLGLPKERLGISNYSSRPSRKPVWRRARFTHNQERTRLPIRTFR